MPFSGSCICDAYGPWWRARPGSRIRVLWTGVSGTPGKIMMRRIAPPPALGSRVDSPGPPQSDESHATGARPDLRRRHSYNARLCKSSQSVLPPSVGTNTLISQRTWSNLSHVNQRFGFDRLAVPRWSCRLLVTLRRVCDGWIQSDGGSHCGVRKVILAIERWGWPDRVVAYHSRRADWRSPEWSTS